MLVWKLNGEIKLGMLWYINYSQFKISFRNITFQTSDLLELRIMITYAH